MELLDGFLKNQKEIFDYFGFVEDWVVPPLDDSRKHYWQIVNDDEVLFGEKDDVIQETGNHYSNEIYKQRFYNKWVYRGKDYTMIMVDTHTDGNKFLSIFDNSKEIK